MKSLFIFLLLFCYGIAGGETGEDDNKTLYAPVINVVQHKLGNVTIPLKIYRYGSRKDVVMINLHSNEKTSVLAAMQWLKHNGGLLIKIENGDNRHIVFEIDTAIFQVDPNHIFSVKGIKNDYVNNIYQLEKAISETQKFAKKILSLIPANPSIVVALHNNFNGDYSIDSYLKGRERATDASRVYKNPAQDADDIFLTTDATLFKQLSDDGFNTILQNAKTVKRDGSLSVYFHEKKIRYLNCETEHGKQGVYYQMLSGAMKYIERRNNNERLVAYKCFDSLFLLEKGTALYKDSIYKGEIKSVYRLKK